MLPQLQNPPLMDYIDDLTLLTYLHEPGVLHAIKSRYLQQTIYTYSGIVLIAINPFAKVAIYSNDVAKAYSGKRKGELEPHLFAIAEDAYRDMVIMNKSQSIIVSGESGAGKTVSAKYIMRYFASVNNFDKHGESVWSERPLSATAGGSHEAGSYGSVEDQVLATNPIMEAFGNAKTTRNDNSSRFGKYLELQFNKDHEIIGAIIRTYLLERSRVVFQPETERNYHIFYQLCEGVPQAEKKELFLDKSSSFHYLNQGKAPKIDGVDDGSDFNETVKSLSMVGISVTTQWKIFRVLAGILQLGNIKVQDTPELIKDDDEALVRACQLLKIPKDELRKWLTKKQISMRQEKIVTNLNAQQSIVVRDSVSKFVYNCVFDWLVRKINESLKENDDSKVKTFIGVLDIYGFEHFKKNSFEQFCINYANEKLQQEFNQHVFKLEQEEYVKEGIKWSFIDFNDNKDCIDLIEGKLGVLSLLDEESKLPAGGDDSLINKLHKQCTENKYFEKPRFNSNKAFAVRHYANTVVYDIDGFIEKNRDTMPDEIKLLLGAESQEDFIKDLITSSNPGAVNQANTLTKKFNSLSNTFKYSLNLLMTTINSTNAHYIRCIKPNEEKKPFLFNSGYVLQQLRACGVLETIRISCAGYPSRFMFTEFAERYKILVHSSKRKGQNDPRKLSAVILEDLFPKDDESAVGQDKYQLGSTKLFLRAGQLAFIENKRTNKINAAAVMVQKYFRGFSHRIKYSLFKIILVELQAASRGFIERKKYLERRKLRSAIKIQKIYRGYVARKKFNDTKSFIVLMQSVARGYLVRSHYSRERKEQAAVKMQSLCRGFLVRKTNRIYLASLIKVQSVFRRRQARKVYKSLRAEQKSMQHVQKKAFALEKKVIELSQAMSRKEDENERLKLQISDLEGNVIKHLRDKIAKLEKHTDDIVKREEENIASFKEKLLKSADKVKELEAEIESKNNLLAGKDKEAQEFQLKITQLENQLSGMESLKSNERQDESSKVEGLLTENASLKEKIKALMGGGGSKARLVQSQSSPKLELSPTGSYINPKYELHSVPSSQSLAAEERKQPTLVVNATSDVNPAKSPPEVLKLFKDPLIDKEINDILIAHLNIPPTLPQDVRPKKDVLFPAHLLGFIIIQSLRYNLMDRLKLLFGNAMNEIRLVIKYDDNVCVTFWMSNLYELQCIMKTIVEDNKNASKAASSSIEQITKSADQVGFFIIEIFYNWLKELKKKLTPMIIPGIIEHQGLPAFMDDSSTSTTSFLSRWISTSSSSGGSAASSMVVSTDKLINWMSKLNEIMNSFYLHDSIRRQIITILIKHIGVSCFNNLIMRKNFCTWKRGMQIQYNVTRFEEWCTKNNVGEAALHLEPLMQCAKLLQLNKTVAEDVDLMFDVCFLLSPQQIKKMLSVYYTTEYENQIPSEIFHAVDSK